jgi:uncharacterized protein VirK/YbjX
MHQSSLEIDSSLEFISKKIKESDSVISPEKNTSSSTLILKMKTGENASFLLENNRILYEESSDSYYLTSENLDVMTLSFLNYEENSVAGVNISIVQGSFHNNDKRYDYSTERETYVNIRK